MYYVTCLLLTHNFVFAIDKVSTGVVVSPIDESRQILQESILSIDCHQTSGILASSQYHLCVQFNGTGGAEKRKEYLEFDDH